MLAWSQSTWMTQTRPYRVSTPAIWLTTTPSSPSRDAAYRWLEWKKGEWAMVCPYSYVSYTMILSFFDVGDRGLTSLGTIRPADDGHDVSWTTLRSHRSTPLPPAGCSHCFICSSYVLHAFPVAEMRRLPTSASLPAKGLSNCWISTLNLPHFPLLLFVTCFIKQNQEDIRHFSLTTQMICTGLQWANKIFLIKIISSRPINSW